MIRRIDVDAAERYLVTASHDKTARVCDRLRDIQAELKPELQRLANERPELAGRAKN